MKKILELILTATVLTVTLHGQTSNPTLQNLYAAGASFNNGASPSVAGSALYAHAVTGMGTYAFSAFDVLPNSLKPLTVTSNVGVGIAQKAFTLGKVPIYVPTDAGISWSGSNTGWQWSTGALASIHIKSQYYILPTVRVVKSSVSNGTGYQPIVGLLFGWGK